MLVFLSSFLKGFAIGIANVIPGFSGGTMALLLRIYDKFIELFTKMFTHPWETLKKNFGMILGILTGLVVGAIAFVKIMFYFPIAISFFCIGLVISCVISIFEKSQEVGTFKFMHYFLFIIFAIIVAALPFLKWGSNITFNWFTVIVTLIMGAICAAAMLLPGISGSLLLMSFGMYPFFMTNLSFLLINIFNVKEAGYVEALIIVLAFAIGTLIGLVASSNIIKRVFRRHPLTFYSSILGLLMTSPFMIIYQVFNSPEYSERAMNASPLEYVIGMALLVSAIALSYGLPRRIKKEETI